ncbi:MAG: DUF2007 domain-containing protein [Bacteroidales bacterium]
MEEQEWSHEEGIPENEMTDAKSAVVFSGAGWETGLVKSLLDNAEIDAYIFGGLRSVFAPMGAAFGSEQMHIMVAASDLDRAKEVVDQYFAGINS